MFVRRHTGGARMGEVTGASGARRICSNCRSPIRRVKLFRHNRTGPKAIRLFTSEANASRVADPLRRALPTAYLVNPGARAPASGCISETIKPRWEGEAAEPAVPLAGRHF